MLNLLEKLNSIVIGFSERDNLQHIPYLASHVSDMDLYINVDARFNGIFLLMKVRIATFNTALKRTCRTCQDIMNIMVMMIRSSHNHVLRVLTQAVFGLICGI